MSDDFDPRDICREEDCKIKCVHRKHSMRIRRLRKPIEVHHRPKGKKPLWQQDAPAILTEIVLEAVGDRPMIMQWIQRDVRDDYGTVTDRTVYRHVRKLVQEARLIKLDLGLAFAAYIRPRARMLSDTEALRDYMLANVDCLPACTKEAVG